MLTSTPREPETKGTPHTRSPFFHAEAVELVPGLASTGPRAGCEGPCCACLPVDRPTSFPRQPSRVKASRSTFGLVAVPTRTILIEWVPTVGQEYDTTAVRGAVVAA